MPYVTDEQLNIFESYLNEDVPENELEDAYLNTTLPELISVFTEDESIKQEFISLCLDGGVHRPHEFSGYGIEIETPPVKILNRSSFVTYFENKLDNGLTFVKLDIQNLRAADLTKDPNNNNSADTILNAAASTLTETSAKANIALKKMGLKGAVVPCRYGGDEFMLGFEEVPSEFVNTLLAKINHEIEKFNGAYKIRDQEPVVEKAKFRKADIITVPADEGRKEIFKLFFDRMILDSQDIDLIDNTTSRSNWVKVRKDEQTPEDRDISALGDELSAKVEDYVQKNELNKDEVYPKIQEFLRDYVHDKMLQERVLVFGDFMDMLQKNEFDKIIALDFPIKIINDNLSLAHGDAAIINVWDQISLAVEPELRKYIVPSRRGATFVLGISNKVPGELTIKLEEVIDKIRGIDSTYINFGHKEKFGVAVTTSISEVKQDNNVNEIVSKMLNDSRLLWFGKLVLANWEHPEYFEYQEEYRAPIDKLVSDPERLVPTYLYNDSKREYERVTKALDMFARVGEFVSAPLGIDSDKFSTNLALIQQHLKKRKMELENE